MRWVAADNSTLALGPLMVSAAPTVDLQVATKKYVDDSRGAAILANQITFTATGNIAATDVQAAVAEVDTEKASKAARWRYHGWAAVAPVGIGERDVAQLRYGEHRHHRCQQQRDALHNHSNVAASNRHHGQMPGPDRSAERDGCGTRFVFCWKYHVWALSIRLWQHQHVGGKRRGHALDRRRQIDARTWAIDGVGRPGCRSSGCDQAIR